MYTIEDLRNGKCAVINDGTLDELRKVINLAFPEDQTTLAGAFMLYRKHDDINRYWYGVDGTDLPKQSVKYFLKPKQMKEITYQQAQELIETAHPELQVLLAKEWGAEIVLKNKISVSDEIYNKMKVCFRDEFGEVFWRIFECPYKDGDPVWVRECEDVWHLRYATGKFEGIRIQTYLNQSKNGMTCTWQRHKPFDPNNLPVNE
jgi:hypothetical protein